MTIAAGAFLLAPAGVASAESQQQDVKALEAGGNAVVDVNTELNCTTHQFTAKVTNKTEADITPNVTRNKENPLADEHPIKPGATAYYIFPYSNNNLQADLAVNVDTQPPVEMEQAINCTEPVTFTVTEASSSTVVGRLQNNSSLTSQTALTKVGMGDIRVEDLGPNESRVVSMPFAPIEGLKTALVTVGTTSGFEGTYLVELDKDYTKPPLPLPLL
jgi:hypothetical protein